MIKIYLVGGAVRDKLLNLAVKEKDWLVVGATPQGMLARHYKPVGKDFPVFLHPETKEEYALARKERKTGSGYKGFECFFSPEITLEEDLARRDLTINAIAQDQEGHYIDPFNGRADLSKRILRHISEAFVEDPVRALRLARFMARFSYLGFSIAPETKKLLKSMARSGELLHLVPERVFQELDQSLSEKSPEQFFDTLREGGALSVVLPEIDEIYSIFAKNTLIKLAEFTTDPAVRLAGILQFQQLEKIKKISDRYVFSHRYRDYSLLASQYASFYAQALNVSKINLLDFVYGVDALRRTERFQNLLLIWQANTVLLNSHKISHFLKRIQNELLAVDSKQIAETAPRPEVIKARIRAAHLTALEVLKIL